MPTYTSNYGWTKPSGSDNVDISVLNNNLDGQDGVIHDAFLNMAPPFSESSTYAVDDIVLYTTGLYKCHTAVVTPGAWTGSTNWQVYKLSEGGSGGTSNYNDLTNKPSINGVSLTGNKTTSDLGINADNVMMSDGVTSVEEAITAIHKIFIKRINVTPTSTDNEFIYVDKPEETTYSALFVQGDGALGSADNHLDIYVQATNVSNAQSLIRYKAPIAGLTYPVIMMFIK